MEAGRRQGIKGRRVVQLTERLGDQHVKPRVTGKVEAFGGGQPAARRHDPVDLRGFTHKGKLLEPHQGARRHDLGKVQALGRDKLGKPHGFGELGGIAPNKCGIDEAVKRLHLVESREITYKAQRFEANQVGKPHLFREVGRVAPKKLGDIGGVGPKKLGDIGGRVGPKKLGDIGGVVPKKLGDIRGVQPARHHAPGVVVNIEIKKITKVKQVFKVQ